MASLLKIPMKKSQNVDLVKPLSTYIKNTFSDEKLSETKDALEELNQLRSNAVVKSLDKHETSLEVLQRLVGLYKLKGLTLVRLNRPSLGLTQILVCLDIWQTPNLARAIQQLPINAPLRWKKEDLKKNCHPMQFCLSAFLLLAPCSMHRCLQI